MAVNTLRHFEDAPDHGLDFLIIRTGESTVEGTRDFTLHARLLTSHSPFFQSKGGTGTTIIRLPNVAPNVFNAYAHWVYSNRLYLGARGIKSVRQYTTDCTSLLGKTYQLGQQLGDQDFMRAVVDVTLETLHPNWAQSVLNVQSRASVTTTAPPTRTRIFVPLKHRVPLAV
ncbi:hypothetical protein EJ06DRAFT_169132 [Trichodelitschia bisporula]|uniref:BTB domain-containing protein n=1 Tax=Trichodelitschia bisporula TaxID=703511 RepID=A0A6G1HN66_9PEZI|nr:hypothetical protein EJ06DRAFT_169132 [Trichodelitschia bisporula]